jgi:hypothetical protein
MEIPDNKIGKELRKAMAEFPEIYKNINIRK